MIFKLVMDYLFEMGCLIRYADPGPFTSSTFRKYSLVGPSSENP